jgi:hypothetical protein
MNETVLKEIVVVVFLILCIALYIKQIVISYKIINLIEHLIFDIEFDRHSKKVYTNKIQEDKELAEEYDRLEKKAKKLGRFKQ